MIDDLTLREYQEEAMSTNIAPRVYTENQVRGMLIRAYSQQPSRGDLISWIEEDLNAAETPFSRLVYPVLGLVGEAGEIANKLKKLARDHGGESNPEIEEAIADEAGDVLWYIAATTSAAKEPLEDVATNNLQKLADRRSRGVLGGSGDKR